MKKSITVIKSSFAAPINGAERSMFERLSMLERLDWKTRIICFIQTTKLEGFIKVLQKLGIEPLLETSCLKYSYKNIEVQAWLENHIEEPVADYQYFNQIVDNVLKNQEQTLLLCNMRDFAALNYCVENKRFPSVFFMTENEFPRPDNLSSSDLVYNAYKKAKNVIVASEFLKQSLATSWGIAARVFHNAIDVDFYRVRKSTQPEFITIFHPYGHKGIDLFLEIASSMLDHKFLVMGGSGPEYRKRKPHLLACQNLKLLPYVEDIRAVLSVAKIVLVPSIWEEAFSRVVVEALSSETPVIAFDRGGIREAGGEAVRYIPFQDNINQACIEQWRAAILEVLNPVQYSLMTELARKHSQDYKNRLLQDISSMSVWFEELQSQY